MKMPFGKYKGQGIVDIPTAYLQWVEKNVPLRAFNLTFSLGDLQKTINFELSRRGNDVTSSGRKV